MSDAALPQQETTAHLRRRAQTLIDLGRPQEAIPVLLQALAQAPEEARTLGYLSLAHGNSGNPEEALRWADRMVAAAPDDEWGHRLRACHLLQRNQVKPALVAAEESLRLAPELPEALRTVLDAHLRLKKWRDAEETAERLRQVAPDAQITYEWLALVAVYQKRWPEVEQHCREALAREPNSAWALASLGRALSHQYDPVRTEGRLPEAISCLYRAMQLNPANRQTRINLWHTVHRYLLEDWVGVCFVGVVIPTMLLALGALSHQHSPEIERPLAGVDVGCLAAALYGARVSRQRFRKLPEEIRRYWRARRWTAPDAPFQ